MVVTHVIVRMRDGFYCVDSPLKVSTRYCYPASSYSYLKYVCFRSYCCIVTGGREYHELCEIKVTADFVYCAFQVGCQEIQIVT